MASPSNIIYTASALSTGDGRNGRVRTSDGSFDLELRTPGADGSEGHGNPEQLFAAGYAACFHSALKGAAKRAGLAPTDSSVTAEVGLGKFEEGEGEGFGLKVTLIVELAGVTQEQGEQLAADAHRGCPYSNATRGNIDVDIQLEVA
jgi:osmotically inducible protein OsmC